MRFGSSSTRSIKVNFGNPVDPPTSPFTNIRTYSPKTIATFTIKDLNQIPVGGTALVRSWVGLEQYTDATAVLWTVTLSFNQLNMTGGQFLSAKRVSTTQWVVQSQNIVNGDGGNLKYHSGDPWVFRYGYTYHAPIKMTINSR